MNAQHRDELTLLICQQWDLVACLEDFSLPVKKRQKLHLQLAKNVYQIAYIVDVYQNPWISFSYRGRKFRLFSDVIKNSHFELLQAEVLLKKVFSLHSTTSVHVIEVEELLPPVRKLIPSGFKPSEINKV